MLWTIFAILIILWLLGYGFHVAGSLIHLLLVVALVVSQLPMAPLCSSGKYLSATPRPAEPESVKNALSAALTANHLVVPAPVVSFIDSELSIRK